MTEETRTTTDLTPYFVIVNEEYTGPNEPVSIPPHLYDEDPTAFSTDHLAIYTSFNEARQQQTTQMTCLQHTPEVGVLLVPE